MINMGLWWMPPFEWGFCVNFLFPKSKFCESVISTFVKEGYQFCSTFKYSFVRRINIEVLQYVSVSKLVKYCIIRSLHSLKSNFLCLKFAEYPIFLAKCQFYTEAWHQPLLTKF